MATSTVPLKGTSTSAADITTRSNVVLKGLPPFLWISAALCLVCALCTPFVYYSFDVSRCWVPWSEATHGTIPWDAYKLGRDVNYPSFMLYALTLIEHIRLAAHAPAIGKLTLTLIKLPSIFAMLGGAALCYYGLRARLGQRSAAIAAAAFGTCVALWFNAAVWGQFDALLSFALIAAVVALVNDRPGWCGAALGLALTIKLQAIVIVPAIGIYWLSRSGWRGAAAVAGGAIAAWSVISAPFLLSSGRHGLIEAYTGAVGYYQELDVYAWNGWFLVHHIGGHLLHLKHADQDNTKILHLITFKQIGFLAYTAYTAFLLVGLWRRPTRYNAALACAMGAFAFFMLPTEIHERYIVPAAALAAILIPATASTRSRSAYALFIALGVVSMLEQFIYCKFSFNPVTEKIIPIQSLLINHYPIGVPITLFDIGLFVWASVMYWRDVYLPSVNEPDPFSAAPTATAQ